MGLIGSALVAASILILFYLGRHPMLLNIVLDVRIPLYGIFIFVSTKMYRDYHNAGELHFWEGMTTGFLTYSVMAVVSSLFILVFAGIESTGFLSEYVRLASIPLEEHKDIFIENFGEEVYKETLLQLPKTTAWDLCRDYLLKSMFIGIFLTIILTLALRVTRKT